MAEDGQRSRAAAAAAAAGQQELPPPPRLVQYGVSPARHQDSREGGGAAAERAEQFPLRQDQRLEAERRQQLAHSFQLLQQKVAQQQQQARLASARSGVPLPPTGGPRLPEPGAPRVARSASRRAAPASGFANHTTVPAPEVPQTASQTQAPLGQGPPATPASKSTGRQDKIFTNRSDQPTDPAAPAALPDSHAAAPVAQTTQPAGGAAQSNSDTAPPTGQRNNGSSHTSSPTGQTETVAPRTAGQTAVPAASPTKRASPAPVRTEPAAKRPRSDGATAASPTHKGKKSWLSRLTNTEEPANGAVPGGDEESGNHAAPPAETDKPVPSVEAKPNGDEPVADADEPEAMDEGSSGEAESAPNDAEQNGALAPRAAAAATKAAAAVKRGPGRPRKRTPADPAAAKKPSFMTLKKSGESFAQTNFCCQIAAKLPKCRECRAVPNQRHSKPTGIYCRFTAFRRVRYTRTGQLTVTGFCDPDSDAGGESDRLWRAALDGRPTMEPEVAKFLLTHVGNQFCDLVCDEEAARRCHTSDDATVAWKRVVQGCREMCDVCETTLFNVHWVCSKCGFAVCMDCYRGRQEGTARAGGEPGRDRDRFQWMLCSSRQPHDQQRLMLTQIVAGDALGTLGGRVHEARLRAGLPLSCQCEAARRLQPAADAASAGELANGTRHKMEDYDGGEQGDKKGSPLTWLADVALSDSKKNSDVSNSESESDADKEDDQSTLRNLLTRNTEDGQLQEKPAKRDRGKGAAGAAIAALDEAFEKVSSQAGQPAAAPDAPELTHFVRWDSARRCTRPRLPARIMTLAESQRLYPDARHAWLCDGRLLRLLDPAAAGAARLFRDQWRRGQPVLCSGVGARLDAALWSADAFAREFGDERTELVDCRTGAAVPAQQQRRFWDGFADAARRLRDDAGQPMALKLHEWPPGEDFADIMPARFNDLMSALPLTEYTRRDGRLNLASCLPDCFVRPDLGPRLYIAYGSGAGHAATNLHLDVSDAVNILAHVGVADDGGVNDAEEQRAAEEAGCDQLTRKRVKEERPGAIWHIYHAADADKIRDLLNKVAAERGDAPEPQHDPLHEPTWYLDGALRRRLHQEYGVEGYAVMQCEGDAVLVPAGAPHQVRNLHSCIKVSEDFVSPENVGRSFELTQQLRAASDAHSSHDDKLQIKNIIYHAMKDAVSCLLDAGGDGGDGDVSPPAGAS